MILYLQPWWVDNMPKNFWAQFFWICMKIYLIVSLICSCLFNQKEKKIILDMNLSVCGCVVRCRQIVILMPNLWLCFWVNTQLEKLHSLSIYLEAVIQVILSLSLSLTQRACACVCVCGGGGVLSKNCFVSLYWFPLYFATGAHIGPEPTTDRFVVVMV
jgi:hypothetical protein